MTKLAGGQKIPDENDSTDDKPLAGTSLDTDDNDDEAKTIFTIKQYPMTHTQEVCNALSTAVPSIFLAWLWATQSLAFEAKIICISAWCHMPVSFSYHMLCAFDYFDRPIDAGLRKLDQSMVHVCCITIAYALSGDVLYGIAAAVVNSWYIFKLWAPGPHDIAFERRTNLVLSIFLYLLPVLVRGDYNNYFAALGSFVAAAVAFQMNPLFYGWGHAAQHLFYCPYMHFLIKASTTLPSQVCA